MIKKIDVYASKIKVGTLALTNDNRVAFQYTKYLVSDVRPYYVEMAGSMSYSVFSNSNKTFSYLELFFIICYKL